MGPHCLQLFVGEKPVKLVAQKCNHMGPVPWGLGAISPKTFATLTDNKLRAGTFLAGQICIWRLGSADVMVFPYGGWMLPQPALEVYRWRQLIGVTKLCVKAARGQGLWR